MKDIAKAIAFDREKFITNEDNSVTLVEKLSCRRIKAIDDYIIKQLYEAYKDKGFQIIGVYSETHMESEVAGILKNKNISYPILNYTDEFARFNTGYVPTTVFVDGNGHIIKMDDGTESIVGSNSYEGWETIIKQYL
jgi:hypothetical protein